MACDNPADLLGGREQMMDDGILIIGFVLQIAAYDHADPRRVRNPESEAFENFITFHRDSVSVTARRVFRAISSRVPFVIQLPPQAMTLSNERYAARLS